MDTPAAPFLVPFRRPELIGRADDLKRLHETLQKGAAALTPALVGQGGIGKTQLAVLYAHEYRWAYPGGIFWLDAATDAEPLATQLGGFALRMGFAQPQSTADSGEFYRQLALAWTGRVASRSDALLVADNLEQPGLLTRALPGLPGTRLLALGCNTVVTSRQRNLPGCQAITVDFLGPEDARALLLREAARTDGGDASADAIAVLLGGLPLALRLAGALLKQNPALPFARCAQVLRERGAISVLDTAGVPLDNYKEGMKVSLKALFAESWNGLPDDRPELKDILKALSLFPKSQHVRSALLCCLLDCAEDPDGLFDVFGSAVGELSNRNLLEKPDDAHLRLHPLVREYAAEQASDDFAEALIVRAAETLRSPGFLARQSADDFLLLLRELPMVMELADGRD
jgi:hypothetical protein